MVKISKDHPRMWRVPVTFYPHDKIEQVPIREAGYGRLEYHNGTFWTPDLKERLHDTLEQALEYWEARRQKRIESLCREIASLAKRKPKIKGKDQ